MQRPRQSSKGRAARQTQATILFLLPELDRTCRTRALIDLATFVNRSGMRAIMASAGGSLVIEAERSGIRHFVLPVQKEGWIGRWRGSSRLAELMQRERVDLVHATSANLLPLVLAGNRNLRKPMLLDLAELPPPHPRLKPLFARFVAARGQILTSLPSLEKRIREELEIPITSIRIIEPGIDQDMFDPARITPERAMELAHLWRVPEQIAVILLTAPLADGNGQMALIEALAKLKRRDFYAVLVGDDKQSPGYRAVIESAITQHRLQGRVIMPDICPDWAAAFWLTHLVVAANNTPMGLNLELLAAQAMGRAAIVTETGANVDHVAAGETAWVVPTDDRAALANALNEALALPTSSRVNLTHMTRDFVAERFPFAPWVQDHLDLYAAMLPSRRLAEARVVA